MMASLTASGFLKIATCGTVRAQSHRYPVFVPPHEHKSFSAARFHLKKTTIPLAANQSSAPTGSSSPGLYSAQNFDLTVSNVDLVLEDVRPYLLADGGNVDVVSVEDGVISLRLQGACESCPSSTTTMKMGIERVLKEKFGDAVKDIQQVYDDEKKETTVQAVNNHLDILRPAIKNYGGSVEVLSAEGGECHVKYVGPDSIGSGTLRVPEVTAPIQDSERLRKAFQGFGTDEEAVIFVLGHRNASQMKKIRETYQQLYNESLIDRLHSELSGDFRNAVILWTTDPPERDAKLANAALKTWRKGIKELQVLVEIACASSPHHLMAVRQAYCSLFDCSLEEDIVSNVYRPLSKFLVGLVSSYRYDKEVVDPEAAISEAARLNEAINKKQLDHDDIIWILSTRNVFQLRETFARYKRLYGNPLEQDIKNCGTGDLESLLNVIIWCIDCPEKHFAKVARDSILGLGTDEDSLTRAFVTRAEIDLSKVRGEYETMYKVSLEDDVKGDTSGDYKKFLRTLLGEII